ncbi:ferritin-like domain-containing protein [Variovorax sp. RCC_210]
MTAEENLMDWLRDAHAMEEQAEKMLSATADRLKNYPVLKERILAHLDQTRQQGRQVRECIVRRGGSPSTVKDVAARITATAQGLSGMFVADEVVKAALSSYTFEHMEIASYRILIAAAREVGDEATQRTCEAILVEEEAMAAWLLEQLPAITQQFLQRRKADVTAKH